MKIKHWEVKEDLGDFYVVDEDGENIALAQRVYPECIICLDEKDAHLIATAPEMLEIMIESLRYAIEMTKLNIEDYIKIIKSNPNYHSYRMIMIIEKATGLTIEEVLETD